MFFSVFYLYFTKFRNSVSIKLQKKEDNPYENINTELNMNYVGLCASNLQDDYYNEIRY